MANYEIITQFLLIVIHAPELDAFQVASLWPNKISTRRLCGKICSARRNHISFDSVRKYFILSIPFSIHIGDVYMQQKLCMLMSQPSVIIVNFP